MFLSFFNQIVRNKLAEKKYIGDPAVVAWCAYSSNSHSVEVCGYGTRWIESYSGRCMYPYGIMAININ